MIIHVTTEVNIKPTRPLTPLAIFGAAQPYAGKVIDMDVDPTMTVQQFADATDIALGIEPAATVQERIIYNGEALNLDSTLADAGLTDGCHVRYVFVLIM
jgi:hypothetical protein